MLRSYHRLTRKYERKSREVRLLLKRTVTVWSAANTPNIARSSKTEQNGFGCTRGSPSSSLIVAHAVCVGAILVTNDKAFSYVAELSTILNWATGR